MASVLYCINADDIGQVTMDNGAAALFSAVCAAADHASSAAHIILFTSLYLGATHAASAHADSHGVSIKWCWSFF